MSGRFAAVGLAVLACIAAIVASCYDVPEPDCGFICGPAGECPSHYTCADDHYCHRNGAPAALVCTADAAVRDADVTDAAADAALAPDAATDGPIDAAVDAAPDAAIDAAPDAPDAAIDAAEL